MKKSFSGKGECSAIVPFFNEGRRVLTVLKVVTKVKGLTQIICIDDGSVDDTYKYIKRKYLNVRLIRSKINKGKTEAIYQALKQTNSQYILLLDADIRGLKVQEIQKAIKTIMMYRNIDMLILKRIKASWRARWQRADTIFSGERILKRGDLLKVYKTNPERYQLEIAINKYMMDNHRQVHWMPSSGVNVFKQAKMGLIQGEWNDFLMHLNLIQYAGLTNYIRQIIFFCRERA